MDKEMSDKTLNARAGPNGRSTGDIEHLVNLRHLSLNPVQLVQLSNGTNAPGVSIGRNTGDGLSFICHKIFAMITLAIISLP